MYSTTYDMSRGIVNQKPFSRKKHRQSFRKMLNRSGVSIPEIKISKKLKNILSRWVWFTILIVWWILILIKSLFFKPEQTISQIKFSDATLATYQDIELFNLISDEVKWKNYYILSSNKDELLKKIQKQFPFVWKIDLQLEPKQEGIITEEEAQAVEVTESQVAISVSSKELSGKDVQEVLDTLTNMGFTNITKTALGDLKKGWFHKEGEVKEISIAGKTKFAVNDVFDKDSEVVITYHSYPN